MEHSTSGPLLEDDAKEKEGLIIRHRLPWLFLGLGGGIIATSLASRFETLLAENIQIAFFIPVIVYMAGAVGTQTESVYVRALAKGHAKFSVYLVKEFFLGLFLGALFGSIMGVVALMWFGNFSTAITVGLAMMATVGIAPVIGIVVPAISQKEHTDPALVAAPFTTIILDILSLGIYFLIASVILYTM